MAKHVDRNIRQAENLQNIIQSVFSIFQQLLRLRSIYVVRHCISYDLSACLFSVSMLLCFSIFRMDIIIITFLSVH